MYSHWKLEGSSEHLYLQIADIIISDIENGRVEVISSGENGKGALIHIQNAATATRQLVIRDGKIEIGDMKQGEKIEVSFDIADSKRYALGVKLYGN